MSDNAAKFVGDIPEHYDRGLGPNIFADYANLLAERCRALNPANVIELAAGTGIVSRRLRDRLSADTDLLVTDLNAPMLDLARRKFSETENVEFAVANAMDLDYADGSFDLIACQFGVMFFPDKVASYKEAARILSPGGHYVFNVWGPMTDNPFSQMAYEIGARFFPGDPPGFYKVPFHYGDPEFVRAELAEAGWSAVEHETIAFSKTIVEPERFARALVFGNPLADEIRALGNVDPTDVADAMLLGLQEQFGPEPLTMPLSATTFVCRAA